MTRRRREKAYQMGAKVFSILLGLGLCLVLAMASGCGTDAIGPNGPDVDRDLIPLRYLIEATGARGNAAGDFALSDRPMLTARLIAIREGADGAQDQVVVESFPYVIHWEMDTLAVLSCDYYDEAAKSVKVRCRAPGIYTFSAVSEVDNRSVIGTKTLAFQ